MTNYTKQLFTTSACAEPKGFDSTTSIFTFHKDEETDRMLPTYKNSLSLFMDNPEYAQIGIGTSHKMRGGYVVDSDNNCTPDQLRAIYERYFVTPSAILYNPVSGHTQTFFFFSEDVSVYSYKNGSLTETKNHRIYMEHLKRLNSFLGLGDSNYTGYWCKNPYNSHFELAYESRITYPFSALNLMIDYLDMNKTWISLPEAITLKDDVSYSPAELTSIALSEDSMDVGYKTVGKEVNIFKPTGKLSYFSNSKALETKAGKTKAEEKRGKFKAGSENRHSTLFAILKAHICYTNRVDMAELLDIASVYNNMLFKNPLSETEIRKEVLNDKTITHTFKNIITWNKCRENQGDIRLDYIADTWYSVQGNMDEFISELRLQGCSDWQISSAVKNIDPEFDSSSLLKNYSNKYKGRYEGRYEGRYNRDNYESVKKNKIETKVKKWLKENIGKNKDYPKKWGKEEIEIAKQIRR